MIGAVDSDELAKRVTQRWKQNARVADGRRVEEAVGSVEVQRVVRDGVIELAVVAVAMPENVGRLRLDCRGFAERGRRYEQGAPMAVEVAVDDQTPASPERAR